MVPPCDPWPARVSVTDERVVYCSDSALTLRVDGKHAEEVAAAWTTQLETRGYVLEQDVSRPRHYARIYNGEGGRLTMAVTAQEDTTISLRWMK